MILKTVYNVKFSVGHVKNQRFFFEGPQAAFILSLFLINFMTICFVYFEVTSIRPLIQYLGGFFLT